MYECKYCGKPAPVPVPCDCKPVHLIYCIFQQSGEYSSWNMDLIGVAATLPRAREIAFNWLLKQPRPYEYEVSIEEGDMDMELRARSGRKTWDWNHRKCKWVEIPSLEE